MKEKIHFLVSHFPSSDRCRDKSLKALRNINVWNPLTVECLAIIQYLPLSLSSKRQSSFHILKLTLGWGGITCNEAGGRSTSILFNSLTKGSGYTNEGRVLFSLLSAIIFLWGRLQSTSNTTSSTSNSKTRKTYILKSKLLELT